MATLGIMVERIDRNEYKWQSAAARAAGFAAIFLFTPDQVNWKTRRIAGWVIKNNRWFHNASIPFPDLIYDRGSYEKYDLLLQAVKVKRNSGIKFVGEWLGNNKWTIHKHMAGNRKLKPHLIPSNPLTEIQAAYTMLDQYKTIIIKPVSTHAGTGIKRISFQEGKYYLKENNKKLQNLSKAELTAKLKVLQNKRQHLIQKWVQLMDDKNRIYDIRVLMQKNESGLWHLTGMGVRQGKAGNITSNLATGGEAVGVKPFLSKLFGAVRAKALQKQLQSLSYEISNHLERSFHKRLVELGLDFGVDTKGRIWIIEANTKPGKKLLEQIGTIQAFKQSLQLPIFYAGYLLKRNKV